VALAVTPASASTAAPKSITVSRGMTVTGFDPAVAAAHGYVIQTGKDGRQHSVKKGQLSPMGYDEVTGNCGLSYINFNGIGGSAASLATGFQVIAPVASGHWEVSITDNSGGSNQPWDIGPNNGTWDGYRTLNLTNGGALGTVLPDYSYAVLDDGTICSSGGPTTTTDIY